MKKVKTLTKAFGSLGERGEEKPQDISQSSSEKAVPRCACAEIGEARREREEKSRLLMALERN